MMEFDPRVDAYIAKAAPFAQPILNHLRELIHTACPEVSETIKWGFPNFEYSGAVMCSMASFKNHMALNFWKTKIMTDPDNILAVEDRESMGHLGKITSMDDLPADKILKKYIKEAARLNKDGVKVPATKKATVKKELEIPGYFTQALAENKKAQKAFNEFSYSHRKEYVEWITEAKTEPTRNKRIATALEWIAEGKGRNWKYEKK